MTNKKALYIILLTVILDIIWLGFIIPALPFLVENFWYTEEYVGLVYWIFSLWLLIGWFIFWRLSDIYWRKNILKITVLINILWYLIFAFSTNIWIFVFARFLSWLWGSGWAIGQAYISDISPENEKTKNMWLIWATFWIGFIIWPFLGALINTSSVFLLWIIPLIIISINFILIYFYLPESKNAKINNLNLQNDSETINLKSNDEIINIQNEDILPLEFHFNKKQLYLLFFTTFIVGLAFSWLQTTFALLVNDRFWYWQNVIWYLFMFIGICSVTYQWLIIKYTRKYFDEKSMIMIWLIFLFISFIWFAYSNVFWILFLLLPFNALWMWNINPAIWSLISKKAKVETWKALWTNASCLSFWNIIWAFLSGYLYAIWNYIPYLFSSLLFLFLFFIVRKFLKR